MVHSVYLNNHEVLIHYTWQGNGDRILFTFHGFGQSGEAMYPLGEALKDEYRTCHIDIFYHGRSYWKEVLGPLTKDQWITIFKSILDKENIDRFSIAAFSMGGKFLLCTAEAMPERLDQLIFIAPDGIKTSKWYSLASYPIVFRHYFRSMIVRPWRFFSLMRILQKVGLLDKGLAKFAATQMDTRRKRRRVYYSWVMFRKLRFDKKRIAGLINRYEIDCQFYLGKYDKIITPEGMQKLTRHLDNYDMLVLESGHNQLIRATAATQGAKK